MSKEEKVQAFRGFDFDGSKEWQEHIQKFDISGANYAEKLMKIKAKWYKSSIDPDFDPSSALDKDQTPPPSTSPSPQSSTQTNGNPTPSAPPKNTSTPGSTTKAQKSPAKPIFTVFLIHFMLMLLGGVCFLPFSSRRMHQFFLQLAIVCHGYKVLQQFGAPSFRPFSALKEWASRALPSTDFQYASMSLVFLPRIPTRLVFVPSTVLATYHVMLYVALHYQHTALWEKYGRKLHKTMVEKQRGALAMNAASEVGVGLFMLVQLLSPARSLLTCFIYWQWLRTRYFSPDAAQYHRQAWHKLGQRAEPVLRMVPFLKVPLGYAQRWFTSQPGRPG